MSEMCKFYMMKGSGNKLPGPSLVLLFLMTFLQHLEDSGVMGQVMCYQCVWQSSGTLPSTAEVNDVCSPKHFNPEIVHQDQCMQGCLTTILYEYDPEMQTTTVKPAQKKNGTSSPAKPPMTFVFRGCPKDDKPRSKTGCEEKSYQNVHQEECFCATALCNGNGGSRRSSVSLVLLWTLALLGPVLTTGFLHSQSYHLLVHSSA